MVQPYLPGGANVNAHLIIVPWMHPTGTIPNGNSIESAIFPEFTVVTNGRTDRPTYRPNGHETRPVYMQQAADAVCVTRPSRPNKCLSNLAAIGRITPRHSVGGKIPTSSHSKVPLPVGIWTPPHPMHGSLPGPTRTFTSQPPNIVLIGWPSSGRYTTSVCHQVTSSTQPCISSGSLSRSPAFIGRSKVGNVISSGWHLWQCVWSHMTSRSVRLAASWKLLHPF